MVTVLLEYLLVYYDAGIVLDFTDVGIIGERLYSKAIHTAECFIRVTLQLKSISILIIGQAPA